MNDKRKALGKGLEQLFSEEGLNFQDLETSIVEEAKNSNMVEEIPLSDLRPNPYQPRKNFDEEALNELAISIKEHGVFQPIIVKKSIKGYEIIAGERRFRASKLAGLTTIPAIVKDFTDEEMMQIALLENLQRENLTAIEEAKAYKSIIESMNITQDELAKKVGKSRSHITNILGLLKLPVSVQDMVLYNKISMGHARVLSKLDDVKKQEDLAQRVIDEDLSVRNLENLTSNSTQKIVNTSRKRTNDEYKYIETYLKEKLGTSVKVSNDKISIKFSSIQDLNRILEIMNIDIDE
ncbi:MAG: ParB/RepB/Spo0J family partition protein [Bacilli bacterium]|nr:ParB/RepB/Spo0J family partition protein [Bacilli bacterium]MBP3635568.1 ParB/RepB/Spo0J family partition protein [Bacilli bacterium]